MIDRQKSLYKVEEVQDIINASLNYYSELRMEDTYVHFDAEDDKSEYCDDYDVTGLLNITYADGRNKSIIKDKKDYIEPELYFTDMTVSNLKCDPR